VWGDDERFIKTYWRSFTGPQAGSTPSYNTFDWGIRDKDGYHFILGRTDDVINVAGHRLGTREIEEAISSHPALAEVAVVGVADSLKGQVPMAFAVLRDASKAATPELAGRGHENRRPIPGCGGPPQPRGVRERAAKNAFGQVAATCHSSGVRRARCGRLDHH
jgi:acyl-coenzyme A synthetase/AMP-(fatty) acid ligase